MLLQALSFVLEPAVIYEPLVDLVDLSGIPLEDANAVTRASVIGVSFNRHQAAVGCLNNHAGMSKTPAYIDYEQ